MICTSCYKIALPVNWNVMLEKVVTNLLYRGNRNVMIYTSCYKLAFPRQSNHQDCFIEIELVMNISLACLPISEKRNQTCFFIRKDFDCTLVFW